MGTASSGRPAGKARPSIPVRRGLGEPLHDDDPAEQVAGLLGLQLGIPGQVERGSAPSRPDRRPRGSTPAVRAGSRAGRRRPSRWDWPRSAPPASASSAPRRRRPSTRGPGRHSRARCFGCAIGSRFTATVAPWHQPGRRRRSSNFVACSTCGLSVTLPSQG